MSRQAGHAAPGQVRIIGGCWRGTRLSVSHQPGLRPSSNRVRETLFNWLQPVLAGARVLDLFAGSGALGLESLSRGAREAVLVERDPGIAEQLRQAVQRLGAGEQAHVVRADAITLLRAPMHGRFDVVFVDPPFDARAWDQVLDLLPPWLADGAWLYLEAPVSTRIAPDRGWILHREGQTREVRYALYRRVLDAADTLATDSSSDGAATNEPD